MNTMIPEVLKAARADIDRIDAQLVKLLAERQQVVERVIAIKTQYSMPALIPERVDAVIENAARLATAEGLSPSLARHVWQAMVDWFVAYEKGRLGR